MFKKTLLNFISAMFVSSLALAHPTATTNLPVETLIKGQYASAFMGIDSSSYVLESQDSLNDLWYEVHGEEAPELNFNASLVVGLVHSFNTGGYTIEIDEILEMDDHVAVHATLTVPGAGCFVTMALTQPHHFVKTANVGKPVRFETNTVEFDCR